ncbi:hypothetical protein [Pantoea sp. BAV 3049]|uniref:hypothetical protein n=1 Tax=Pantoea sp. BAV 3049 TaxID=2654188 RepID=UPI00131E27DC|nr:hypothetical protein [Pantoea sp. BAV 3049]
MALRFKILAGKHDSYEGEYYENIKFADDADSWDDAQRIIQEEKLSTYPICRVEVTGFKDA